jgi:hypothetical protein
MKKSLAVLWAVIALVGLLATGCNKSNEPDESAPAGVTDEESAMKYFANNDEFVNNDEQTIDDEDIQPTDYGTFGRIDANIIPLRWGRFVTSVTRTVTITVQPGDSIAIGHVHKVIAGILKIRGLNTTGDTVTIQKPFTDNADRNIIFKRVGRGTNRFWLHWVPVATSLVDGGTPNGQINITKLQFFTAGDTITITDPLRYFLRYRWLRMFVPNAPKDVPEIDGGRPVTVRATLVSASADTDLVALRFGQDRQHRRRMPMRCISEVQVGNNYERAFEKTFNMHFHRGSFHTAVDAMTKATLFDDDVTNYAVSWWGIPYRVN